MNKLEISTYLVNLVTIMTSKESAGLARGATLAQEYNRNYDLLIETITKENENGGTGSRSTQQASRGERSSGEAREFQPPSKQGE